KLSDAPLETCPSCGQASFRKQLTAAGFQLKGSGWYATDFKGGGTAAPASVGTDTPAAAAAAPAKVEPAAAVPVAAAPSST
ncbi:MAG: FmdB family transcriptional regulator, partial [Burkholderiales bacterium PBB4]